MDLLELRQVPRDTKDLVEIETAQRGTRTRGQSNGSRGQQKEPTPGEIARLRADQNAEIEKENALLMKERFDLFSFFVTLCLPAVIPVKAWDKYHKQKKISEIATSTDEAFAMILFVNNYEIFVAMCESGKKTYKEVKQIDKYKDLYPKYTAHNGREVGWNEEGMEHFERLVEGTLQNRQPRIIKTGEVNETYVDMDSKFYDSVQSKNANGAELVLNPFTVRKKKRRRTEL